MATRIVTPTSASTKTIAESLSEISSELFDVVTLIHAGFDAAHFQNLADVENLTGLDSRRESLLIMARDKAASVIKLIDAIECEVQHG